MYWSIDESTAHLDHKFPDAGITRADLFRLSLAGHLRPLAAFFGQSYSPTAETPISPAELMNIDGKDLIEAIEGAQEKKLTHMARGLYFLPPRIVEELALTGSVCVEYAFREGKVIKPFATVRADCVFFLQSEVLKVADLMTTPAQNATPDPDRKRRAVERMNELKSRNVRAYLKQTAEEFKVSVSRIKQWRDDVELADKNAPNPCSLQGSIASLLSRQTSSKKH